MRKLIILLLVGLIALTSCSGYGKAETVEVANVETSFTAITESSESIKAYIRECEGFTASAIWDYKAYSIGYGHTSTEVHKGDTITKEEAIKLFNDDIKLYENAVVEFSDNKNIILNQNQFDALVSFCYNLGANCFNKYEEKGYSLIDYLTTGEYTEEELIDEWTSYCHAGSVELAGLKARRLYEVTLFLNA